MTSLDMALRLDLCHRHIIEPKPRPRSSTPTLHTQPQHPLHPSRLPHCNSPSLFTIARTRLEPKHTLAVVIDRNITIPIHRLLAPDRHIVRLPRHHGDGLRHLHEPVVVCRFSLGLEAMVAIVRVRGSLACDCAGCEGEAGEGPGSVAGVFEVAVDDDLGRYRGRCGCWC
jgi:hypothetical protein